MSETEGGYGDPIQGNIVHRGAVQNEQVPATYQQQPVFAQPHYQQASHPIPQRQMQLTDQTPENPTLVVIAWLIAACTLGYMLPWAVAVSRRKSNHAAIGLVTFFLGWTAVGWIIALVMAAGAHHPISAGGTTQVVIAQSIGNVPAEGLVSQPQTAGTGPPPGYYPSPDGAGGQRYWDGTNWA